MAMGNSIIQLEGVTVDYDGFKALNNLNFIVDYNELRVVIGPNGAGKTTVFNMLTGIYKPTSGSIKLNGEELIGFRPYQFAQRGIARTFQNIRLFAESSVIDNVKMAYTHQSNETFLDCILRTQKVVEEEIRIDEKAMSLLKIFGLDAKAETRAKNLSYGEQRKLEIVRALMLEPKILLLDEPVAGMITAEIAQMAELVKELRENHDLTIILIEHHMNFVMPIADRIQVLNFGKTIAQGLPAEIQRNPEVIKAYLGGGFKDGNA